MQKDLNLEEKIAEKIDKLKPIVYMVLTLRAFTFDSLFAQTKNPSDYFEIPFGNFVMQNIPENLDYQYWLERLKNTDSLATLAIEFESLLKDIPVEIRAEAEKNYQDLFQDILKEISEKGVQDRAEKIKILVDQIKLFNSRPEDQGKSYNSVSLINFLTEIHDEKIICAPATILALDYAKKLGIDGLKTAITFKHVFIYDEIADGYIDLNDDVVFKNESEAKNNRGQEFEHEGIYLLPDKNILGILASNMIYAIDLKDPYFQNKNKMLYDLAYNLGNPGIIFDYALNLESFADKEDDLSKKENLYHESLKEAEKINQTAFSFKKTKKLVSDLREKIKEKYLSDSTK